MASETEAIKSQDGEGKKKKKMERAARARLGGLTTPDNI